MVIYMKKLIVGIMFGFLLIGMGSVHSESDSSGIYDDNGRLIQSIDENGKTVWFVYNASGTLVEKHYEDGSIEQVNEPTNELTE